MFKELKYSASPTCVKVGNNAAAVERLAEFCVWIDKAVNLKRACSLYKPMTL
jgi:hypothetical protein